MAYTYLNFAQSLVATAPSPATSGTSLTVTTGDGALFSNGWAVCWPPNVMPTKANAEIVLITAIATDTLTITRTQEGSTNQSIAVGWQFDQNITAAFMAQFATLSGATFTGSVTVPDLSVSGLTGATAASRYVGATTSGAPVSGTFAVGDFVIDQTGKVWVCTVAGTPGTWVQIGGASGALTLISSQVLAAAASSVTFSSIPGTYNHLKLVILARSTAAANNDAAMLMQFNGDTTSNYDNAEFGNSNTSVGASLSNRVAYYIGAAGSGIPANTMAAGVFAAIEIIIPLYSGTTLEKTAKANGAWAGYQTSSTAGGAFLGSCVWKNTAAITSIVFSPFTGPNFAIGSAFYLYGVN